MFVNGRLSYGCVHFSFLGTIGYEYDTQFALFFVRPRKNFEFTLGIEIEMLLIVNLQIKVGRL